MAITPASVGVNQPVRMPPQQNRRDHHRQRRRSARGGQLPECGARPAKPLGAEEVTENHQADSDEETRHDAAQEQAGNRDVADRAIDHRHDRRRHERGDRGCGGDQGGGERRMITLPSHGAGHGAREDRDIGGRRSGHAGEEHRKHGGNLRQPATDMADQRLRQIGDPNNDVGRGHQLPHQQKERNGHQRFRVHAVEQLRDHRLHGDRREHSAHQDAGDQRERHRHAEISQRQEQHGHDRQQDGVGEDHMPASRPCSWPPAPVNPFLSPLAICSSENSATSAPLIGIAM